MSANGVMAKKMDMALTHSSAVTNTLAIGGIAKRNGRGTQTCSDGSSYVGEWRDDQKNGRGTQTYSDGSSYVGEFRGDKRNGQGVLTWPNRDKYVGEWTDNKENGKGT